MLLWQNGVLFYLNKLKGILWEYQTRTKWAADIFAEGNASNQSKGSVGASYGSGWIIEPNQEILLEIESLEAAQNISARLELYNGLLDLPL